MPANPGDAATQATAYLLSKPSMPVTELRSQGVDPDPPTVIKLLDADGMAHVPLFQLEPDGLTFRQLVLDINDMLGAAGDPWGIASWWLKPTNWLDDKPTPASLLDTTREPLLLNLAQLFIEG